MTMNKAVKAAETHFFFMARCKSGKLWLKHFRLKGQTAPTMTIPLVQREEKVVIVAVLLSTQYSKVRPDQRTIFGWVSVLVSPVFQ